MTDRLRRWAPPAGAVLFFVALACCAFAPLFSRGAWFTWDAPDEYWPDLHFLCRSLHEGRWPLWNPYDRGGYPFHADPQTGMYYPLNWGICALGGRDVAIQWSQWRVVMHFVIAGCGMTGFLRALGLRWGAAMLGGVAFMFAPYQRRMWEVNLSYTVAWLPWLLWSVERLSVRPDLRDAAALALLAAVTASVGSPPSLYFTALTVGVYALVRCAPRRNTWAPLALAGGLTLAMCAVMVVPTLGLSHLSVQQAKDFASISAGGYPSRGLGSLVWPEHKLLYLGVPVIGLAVVGAVSRRGPLTRAQRITFSALALFALLMMLGTATPLYRVMYDLLPGVRAFRMPPRYSAVLGAAAAVLAAGGASVLPRVGVTVWVAIAAVLASVWPALPPGRSVRHTPIPGGAERYAALRARMGDVGSSWRVHDEFGLGLRAGTRFHFRDLRGYQDPLQLRRYSRVMNELGGHPRLLEQFNVRYLLRGPHFLHGTEHHFLPAGAEASLARELGDGVWETRSPLPAAYLVEHCEVLRDGDAVMERLLVEAPTAVCLLEAEEGRASAGAAGEPVAATDVRLTPDALTMRIDSPRGGWLVVQESWYPGWVATVDGAPVAIRRANYLMRAVAVPPGRHAVAMRYAPPLYRPLAAVALMALAASITLLFRRARRSPPRSPPETSGSLE